MAFLRGSYRVSVFVGDLTDKGRRLVNSRQVTLDDNIDIPLAWTPDSREVIFSSKRVATRLIYKQALDRTVCRSSYSSAPNMDFYIARLSPDKAWLILEGGPSGSRNGASIE